MSGIEVKERESCGGGGMMGRKEGRGPWNWSIVKGGMRNLGEMYTKDILLWCKE